MFEAKMARPGNLFARSAATLLRKAIAVGSTNKNYVFLMALAAVLEHAHASEKPSPQSDATDEPQANVTESVSHPIEVAIEGADAQQALQLALAELAQTDPAIQELIDGQLNLILLDPTTGQSSTGNEADVYAIGQHGNAIRFEDGQSYALAEQDKPLLFAQAEIGGVTEVAASGVEAVAATEVATVGAATLSMPMMVALGALGVAAAAGGGSSSTPNLPATPTNSAPTAVALSASTVAENAAGAVIGTLTVTNPDAGNTHTLTVDDARFEVVAGQLKLKDGNSLDFETASTVNVTVTATDAGGLSKAQAFAINVTDVFEAPPNSAPTAVALSASTVAENAAGAVIGTLTITDPDAGNTHTLTVDDARFEVVAGQLKLKDGNSLDFETASTVNVTVTATDTGGLSKAQAFAITVSDVAETTTLVGTADANTINFPAGLDDFIITGLAGNDTITTGVGNDIIRPGEGADTVTTGTGNDIVVVVGQTATGQYAQSDITNPGGSGIDLSSVISLADLNGRAVSEVVAGENIDGGTGTNRLVIYGNVDLTGVTLTNITQFQVNSTVTISAQQLTALGLNVIFGDGESVLNITNSGADPVTLDLSDMTFSNFRTLNVSAGVTVVLDQADVDSLQNLSGEGTLKASTATGTLNLASKYVTLAIQSKDGTDDATHGGGTFVAGKLLIGGEAADTLTGGATADRIEGGAGNDTLVGGDGNDVLRGGAGVDSMDGGAGDDTFVVVGDISGGGKVDSVADTAALGFPLTNLNGKNLNEDEGGSAEVIRGGDGDDTLYVYGTVDLSNYDITGIEHIEIRSKVTFNADFLNALIASGNKTLTGDGSSTIRIYGGTPSDPLVVDLSKVSSLTLANIGQIDLGPNVVLKVASVKDFGGARILTGDGKIQASSGSLDLTGYTKTATLAVKNFGGSDATGAEVLDKVVVSSGATVSGDTGDDYLVGSALDEHFYTNTGNDVISGNGGNDVFIINGSGKKIILDSSGIDTLNLSKLSEAATINLTDGGHVGTATTIQLGSGSATTGKTPLDMFIVEDLSGSFGDDVATVRGLLDTLIVEVRAVQPDSKFGAGSFVDKPAYPFGDAGYGDYVYRTDAKITSDTAAVKTAFNNMVVLSGYDGPEAQLEALYQIALRTIKDDASTTTTSDEIGFRPGSMRVVVLATDADYHQAGDFSSAGPNNGDTILNGTPPGSGEDYPFVAQVKDALLKANIYPIFAITGVSGTYESLVTQLGVGDVVALSGDSSNLINSIKTGLTNYKVDFIENLVGTGQADNLTGNSLDNRIVGGSGEDMLTGLGGDDTLIGGEGNDTAAFSGAYKIDGVEQYVITVNGGQTVVRDISDRDGTDTLTGIEALKFSDQSIELSDVGSKPLKDAKFLFDSNGYYGTFAGLCAASYFQEGDKYLNSSGNTEWEKAAFSSFQSEDGFQLMSSTDLDLFSGIMNDIDLPAELDDSVEWGFSDARVGNTADGRYEGDNSYAIVGKTADALFIAFRGTNGTEDWKDDFVSMKAHYLRYKPLITAINNYIDTHGNIKDIYVTGHSLGGAMVEAFMAEHPGSKYHGITYEGAPYNFETFGSLIDPRLIQFEFNGDLVPDLGSNSGFVVAIEDFARKLSLATGGAFLDIVRAGMYHPLIAVAQVAYLIDSEGIRFESTAQSLPSWRQTVLGTAQLTVKAEIDGFRTLTGVGGGDDEIAYATFYRTLVQLAKTIVEVAKKSPVGVIDEGLKLQDMMKNIWNQFEASSSYILGGAGKDKLIGGDTTDQIYGGDGNDILSGASGNDYINGGGGDDIIDKPRFTMPDGWADFTSKLTVKDASENTIWAETVKDLLATYVFGEKGVLSSPVGSYLKTVGSEVIKNGFIDLVVSQFEWLAEGSDTLAGGMGNDIYFVNTQKDIVIEQIGEGDFDAVVIVGNNALTGGAGLASYADSDVFNAPDGIEVVIMNDDAWSNSSNFSIIGGQNDSYLVGNAGNNNIYGGTGRDVLIGGADEDHLYGGNNNDILLGGKYDAFLSSFDKTEIPSKVRELIDQYADAATTDNHDVSYMRGGFGIDRMFGGGDNDYFLIDAKFGDNAGNVDLVNDFYIADLLSDPTMEDYLVFSADQLGGLITNVATWDWSSTSVDGNKAYYLSSSAKNFMSISGVSDYAAKLNTSAGEDPLFVLDTVSGFLYFDQDGVRDVGDLTLLAHISSANYGWKEDLASFDADQILIMNQVQFDLV